MATIETRQTPDGKHGCLWRNCTKETVTVTLVTNGEYSNLVRVD